MSKKLMIPIVLALLLSLNFTYLVSAKELGNITVAIPEQPENKKEMVKDISFSISKVAELKDGKPILLPEYVKLNMSFNDLSKAQELEAAALTLAQKVKKEQTKLTNQNGRCSFEDLTPGIYLVQSEKSASYQQIAPTIVSIPFWDESKQTFQYEQTIVPKMVLKRAGTIVASTFKLPSSEDLQTSGAPRTGDDAPILFFVILVALSGGTILTLNWKKNKRGKQNAKAYK